MTKEQQTILNKAKKIFDQVEGIRVKEGWCNSRKNEAR